MLDLQLRLRDERDAAPAAAQAAERLSRADWQTLVAFAQAICVHHELRDPSRLIVVESREIARP